MSCKQHPFVTQVLNILHQIGFFSDGQVNSRVNVKHADVRWQQLVSKNQTKLTENDILYSILNINIRE